MFGYEIGFDKPAYLLLLLLLPLLWVFSFRSLAGLGRWRRVLALALRSLVLALIVMALAEVQLRQRSDRLTVIYLLDQSESIPVETRDAMLRYVIDAVSQQRRRDRGDRAGVIVFGRNANIQVPPFDDDVPMLGGLESYLGLRTDATNLEAALKLAQAAFTDDSAKRIVIVTDGNENLGDARTAAATLAENGIGLDVVPVKLTARAEVAVEKVMLPQDVRRGQPMEARVIVNNYSDRVIPGKLRVTRRVAAQDELLGEIDVELKPGKSPFSFSHRIEQPAVYTYQADFVPNSPADDLMTQNNRATTFTHVRGKGRVLLIEDWQQRGGFNVLVDRLRENNIEVDLLANDQLYSSLAELQGYDSVILANVPRSSGDDASSVSSFSDEQVEMLVRNTEQMGAGLVMLGGPESFGVGGWSNTLLEKAMPVDFQIKNSKIRAVGALVLMMHASEIADGNFWQKEVAKVAIQSLGPMDYCGLIHWDFGGDQWLWGAPQGLIQVGTRRNMMLARLSRMTPGDMPEFDPAMKMALAAFGKVNASVKHMIVVSDGDPSQPGFSTVTAYQTAGVQVSTVAVGAHGPAGHQTLQDIAQATGGRYYVVKNPKALPKIYQSEVRRVAKPLIYEPPQPVAPQIIDPSHEIVQGIGPTLPPITGFVLTTVKDSPLVEVLALSPQPSDERNATILAAWTYGLGRTAVLTTDTGQRWAKSWPDWDNYDKLFTQLVRWSMRPVNENDKFSVATDVRDGKVRVVINALDKDDEFLNFLNFSSAGLDPDLKPFDLQIEQVAPGRYVGEFEAARDGNYFLTISPGAGQAPLLSGVNVPYSSEFRDRETNMVLLRALAELQPKSGQPGAVIEGDLDPDNLAGLLNVDTFRGGLPPAVSIQDVWPLFLVICAGVFFADVFVRRVAIRFDWVRPALRWVYARLFGEQVDEQLEERLGRLRSRKAEVADQIDERRAAARFEPSPGDAAPARDLDQVLAESGGGSPDQPADPRAEAKLAPDETQPAQESYTSRLLKAKQQAWKDRP